MNRESQWEIERAMKGNDNGRGSLDEVCSGCCRVVKCVLHLVEHAETRSLAENVVVEDLGPSHELRALSTNRIAVPSAHFVAAATLLEYLLTSILSLCDCCAICTTL